MSPAAPPSVASTPMVLSARLADGEPPCRVVLLPDTALETWLQELRQSALGVGALGMEIAWIVRGVNAPDDWLPRLRAALREEPAAGSISPVCPGSSLHSPFPEGLPALGSAWGPGELDGWLRSHAHPAPLEVGQPLPLCGVLSVAAVAAIQRSPADWPWPLAVSRAGLIHAVCAAIAVTADRMALAPLPSADPRLWSSLLTPPGRWTAAHPLEHVRRALAATTPPPRSAALPNSSGPASQTGARLHIAHSWGGGLSKWVLDFCRAERAEGTERRSLVLRSIGVVGAYAQRLALFADDEDAVPLRFWELGVPIHATAPVHLQVRTILREVIDAYQVDSVVVSSLIGHSLDVLRTGLPTTLVAHDHHPWCIALYAHFPQDPEVPPEGAPTTAGGCQHCDAPRLARCQRLNPGHRYFRGVDVEDWDAVRCAFVDTLAATRPWIVCPSPSVAQRWAALMPGLPVERLRVIPHGLDLPPRVPFEPDADGPLRLLVIGRLTPEKGADLLETTLKALGPRVHLTALGCGEEAPAWLRDVGAKTVPHFESGELPTRIAQARPHLGLTLSIVPETFSYALSELWHAGVPVLATRIGALGDRIEDGVTGWLVEPTAQAVVERLEALGADRTALAHARAVVLSRPTRGVAEMVADHRALLENDEEMRVRWTPRPGLTEDGRPDRQTLADPPLQPRQLGGRSARHEVLFVRPDVSWRQAWRGFLRYSLHKAQRSSRLPAWVRQWLLRLD